MIVVVARKPFGTIISLGEKRERERKQQKKRNKEKIKKK
jgi:hypothetical protein